MDSNEVRQKILESGIGERMLQYVAKSFRWGANVSADSCTFSIVRAGDIGGDVIASIVMSFIAPYDGRTPVTVTVPAERGFDFARNGEPFTEDQIRVVEEIAQTTEVTPSWWESRIEK